MLVFGEDQEVVGLPMSVSKNGMFAAHQPNFAPHVGFWLKMDAVGVFGLMRSAQYSKGDYHNRVMIGANPTAQWLTIPVSLKLGDKIEDVVIAQQYRGDKIVKTLKQVYGRSKFWPDHQDWLCSLFDRHRPGHKLVDLNIELIAGLVDQLGIDTGLCVVPANTTDPSNDLIAWTTLVGSDCYVSGQGGRGYIDAAKFGMSDVELIFHQCEVAERYRHCSVLTALMELGPNWRDAATSSAIARA